MFVAVIGFDYGSIEAESGLSYTEMELETARAAGIPRFVFLVEDMPAETVDDRGKDFRARLRSAADVTVATCTPSDLENKVADALRRHVLTSLPPVVRNLFSAQRRAALPTRPTYVDRRLVVHTYDNLEHALAYQPDALAELIEEVTKSEWLDPLRLLSRRGNPGSMADEESVRIAREMRLITRGGDREMRTFVLENVVPDPTIDAVACRISKRHVLVVGDPGQGRTVMSLQLAAHMADVCPETPARSSAGQTTRRRIAIRVVAADLAHQQAAWRTSVARAANLALGQYLDDSLPDNLIESLPPDIDVLVIVDGVDEVTDPALRSKLLDILEPRLAEPAGRIRLLLTSRPLSPTEQSRLPAVHLDSYVLPPFTASDVELFARAWFQREEGAKRFLTQIVGAKLEGVVTNPLFASLAASTHAATGTTPPSRFRLLESFVVNRLSLPDEAARQWKTRVGRFNDTPVVQSAFNWYRQNRRSLLEIAAEAAITAESPNLLQTIVQAVVAPHRGHLESAVLSSGTNLEEFVAATLADTGLVRRHGEDLRFVHLKLAEHLATRKPADTLSKHFRSTDPLWTDARWLDSSTEFQQSLLQHYAARCTNVGDLLTWLLVRDRRSALLATELMAEGVRFSDRHAELGSTWLQKIVDQAVAPPEAGRWWEAAIRIPHPAIANLVESVVHSMSPSAEAALTALLRFAPDRGVSMLVEQARSILETPEVRLHAAARLIGVGQRYPEPAVEAVSDLVSDALIRVRYARGLVMLCSRSLPVADDVANDWLQKLSGRTQDSAERIFVALAIHSLGDGESARAAVAKLTEIAADPAERPMTRLRACIALVSLERPPLADPRAVLRLLDDLLQLPEQQDAFRMQVVKVRTELRKGAIEDARRAAVLIIEDHERRIDSTTRLAACRRLLGLDPKPDERATAWDEISAIASGRDPLAYPEDVRFAVYLLSEGGHSG